MLLNLLQTEHGGFEYINLGSTFYYEDTSPEYFLE